MSTKGLSNVGNDTYLSLEEVGGNDLAPVAIEEGKRSAEGRDRDTPDHRLCDDAPPAGLRLVDGLVEEIVEQHRLELVVLLVGGGDVTKEDGFDDATTSPHLRDTGVVEVPIELIKLETLDGSVENPSWRVVYLLGSFTHEHEALSVGDYLRRVEGLLQVIDELLLVALEGLLLRARDDFASARALGLDGGQATSKDGLTDERDWIMLFNNDARVVFVIRSYLASPRQVR